MAPNTALPLGMRPLVGLSTAIALVLAFLSLVFASFLAPLFQAPFFRGHIQFIAVLPLKLAHRVEMVHVWPLRLTGRAGRAATCRLSRDQLPAASAAPAPRLPSSSAWIPTRVCLG